MMCPDAGSGGKLQPPESGVTVRMYNVGAGDCFLLAFRGDDGKARYVLTDFGSHQDWHHGEDDERSRLAEVAADIAQATGSHLHVATVSHQHFDHVMGFFYGRHTFEHMKIDELWLGWPENEPGQDEDADKLRNELGKKKKQSNALRAAAAALRLEAEDKQESNPLAGELAGAIEGLLSLSDEALPDDDVLLGATSEYSNAAQYTFLKQHVKKHGTKKEPSYLKPQSATKAGTAPIGVPGVQGVEVYALGPPTDIEAIKEHKVPDWAQLVGQVLDERTAFYIAALVAARKGDEDKLEEEDKQTYWRSLPFERNSPYRIRLKDLRTAAKRAEKYLPFFQKHYGFADDKEHGAPWRRIDIDWLAGALAIALRDSDWVNNTSLVLAIRFTPSNRVLLFAGDAETGNWGSWADTSWAIEAEDGETETVTGKDLIEQTVFYKVGHHGSENATLPDYVESMSQLKQELVAMIPSDWRWAWAEKEWHHPDHKVLKLLRKHARSRVIRYDRDLPEETLDQLLQLDWQELQKRLRELEKEWDQDNLKHGEDYKKALDELNKKHQNDNEKTDKEKRKEKRRLYLEYLRKERHLPEYLRPDNLEDEAECRAFLKKLAWRKGANSSEPFWIQYTVTV